MRNARDVNSYYQVVKNIAKHRQTHIKKIAKNSGKMSGGKCFSTGIKVLSLTVKVALLLTSLVNTGFTGNRQQE
jgi:hypothetical protein